MLNVAQLANNLTRLFNNIFTRLTTLEQGGGGGGGDITGTEIVTTAQAAATEMAIFPFKWKSEVNIVQDPTDPNTYGYNDGSLGTDAAGSIVTPSYIVPVFEIAVNIVGIYFMDDTVNGGYKIQIILKTQLDEESLNLQALRVEGVLLDTIVENMAVPMGGDTIYMYGFSGNDLAAEGNWPGDAMTMLVEIADV